MTTLTCKVPSDWNARLEALARARRVTKSAVLRAALERTLRGVENRVALTAFSVAAHVCGRVCGPKDLSTHRKHMKGFGE